MPAAAETGLKLDGFAEDKGIVPEGKERVHRLDHVRGGAVIDAHGVAVFSWSLAARLHVGEDIRPAKGVDRLLGIADHAQRRSGSTIEAGEEPVLHRIGVLELIHQGHGVSGPQVGGQPLAAAWSGQGGVELREQVVKGHQPEPLFAPGQDGAEKIAGLGKDEELELIDQGLVALIKGIEDGEKGMVRRLVAFLLQQGDHHRPGQPLRARGQGQRHGWGGGQVIHGPAELRHLIAQPVGLLVAKQAGILGQDLFHLAPVAPQTLLHLEKGGPSLLLQGFHVLHGYSRNQVALHHRRLAQGPQQSARIAKGLQGPVGLGIACRIETGPPEILDDLPLQGLLALHQLDRKRGAGFKGMFLEHSLAKAVNGVDCGLVHAHQGIGKALPGQFRINPIKQGLQQRVIAGSPLQNQQGLAKTFTDAIAQLTGGSPGKGDHQNLVHPQALLEQQTEVEQCQGVGLARPGAGLKQQTAVKRQFERFKTLHPLPP